MNRRIPTMIRSLALLAVVAFGAAGCVGYPVGGYGYGRGYHSGWRAPATYAYAVPRGGWGGGYGGGWGHHRHW